VTSALAGIPDYLAMNTAAPPFNNKALRQAVAWALDRNEIRAVAYFGAGETGSEEVPTGSKWYDNQDPYKNGPDLTKAKAKMQEAGLAGGISVNFLGLPQYPELLKTGEVVQQQLKKIGINMQIQQVDVSVWFDHFSKGTYQITSAYQERTIDPDNFYSLVLKTGAPINATKYSNPAVDKLIDQAAGETDEAKRKQLYTQIRQIIFDDVPLIFAHYETLNYLSRKQVVGSTINPTLELRLENVSKA
jgi:peptide/nickel transport system substrate-binding protein